MKPKLILISAFALSLSSFVPATAAPQEDPDSEATSTASTLPRIESLQLPEGEVAANVRLLREHLKQIGHPPMNVLLITDAGMRPCPQLELRNVTGPEALQLIATASHCGFEVLISRQNPRVIGYKLEFPIPPTEDGERRTFIYGQTGGLGDSKAGGSNGFGASGGFGGGERGQAEGFMTKPKEPTTQPGALSSNAATPDRRAFMQSRLRFFRSKDHDRVDEPQARVYGLGRITAQIDFKDIEATLSDLLRTEGLTGEDIKLALHEKTNVLVVRGPDRAHELVQQLIDALDKNTSHLGNHETRRQLAELEAKLEAQVITNARLQDQLQEAEREMRQLRNRLPKPPGTDHAPENVP